MQSKAMQSRGKQSNAKQKYVYRFLLGIRMVPHQSISSTRHLITLLLPGPGRCAPEGLTKHSNAKAIPNKAKQVKAMQRNATPHLFPYPYPQKPLQVTPFPLAVLQNLRSGYGVAALRCCRTSCVAKPAVLQNQLCC